MTENGGLARPISVPGLRESGYYGLPVIHGAHWKWLIIWYFFFGGISGAAAAIATFARLYGGSSGASVGRIATYVSFFALAPCPPLLILDLGRPGRFLNMLRAFRTRSPMSLGTWGLTVFGFVSLLNTCVQVADDLAARSRRHPPVGQEAGRHAIATLGAVSGLFVAGYTGVLLAATAVPLWSKRPAILGPLFLSSAMTSGTAAITTVAAALDHEHRGGAEKLRVLETIFTVAEGSLLVAWIIALGPTARPVTEGRPGFILRHGVFGAGMVAPLALSAASRHLPRRMQRPVTLIASVLTLVGVFALRYAVIEGGRISAGDPRATFDMTG